MQRLPQRKDEKLSSGGPILLSNEERVDCVYPRTNNVYEFFLLPVCLALGQGLASCHLIFATVLWGRYYYQQLPDEETKGDADHLLIKVS